MVRLGLCCLFRHQPIRFRRATAKYLSKLAMPEQRRHLSEIALSNAENLMKALIYCQGNGIGAFRINSQILPLITHPVCGYDLADLPDGDRIVDGFKACGRFCRKHDIRTTFHPDQFIVLASPHPEVVRRSLVDLAYQAKVARWVHADVINIHAGGGYGDQKAAMQRLRRQIDLLPDEIRNRLTLENDDRSYTPVDLLPLCREMQVPLVYDVHHHRCRPDEISVEEATERALSTWNREPLFHISSPMDGWQGKGIRSHHDYINIHDFPQSWLPLTLTVEVEAKAKEAAVLQLLRKIRNP